MTNPDNNEWTGYNDFVKPATLGAPVHGLRSGPQIGNSAILLASNYVALGDVQKTTDVAVEAPATASWGGNFATYIQHKVAGKCGMFGTLTGGIRAQLETRQERNGAPINDACAGYLGLFNDGVDVGGFGLHVDAYHAGFAQRGHSTYGMSAECWKQAPAGIMAGYVVRAQQGDVDYGLVMAHSGGQFKRGLQLGCPPYGSGGVQGAPGTTTLFEVGIDLSWATCHKAAIQVGAGDAIVLSGQPQPQTSALVDACNMLFDGTTGMFAVRNGGVHKFDVNMSNGIIWQNGAPTWAGFSPVVSWAFNVGPGKTVPDHAGRTPAKWLRVRCEGEDYLMPLFRP